MKIPTASPAGYLLAGILIMAALDSILPGPRWIGWPWNGLCVLPAVAGGGLTAWGMSALSRHGTPVEPFEVPEHLVTTGPYRFSRNPMYVGSGLFLVSMAILLGSLVPWVVIPAWVWVMQGKVIRPEEERMLRRFGDEALRYQGRTRRWL